MFSANLLRHISRYLWNSFVVLKAIAVYDVSSGRPAANTRECWYELITCFYDAVFVTVVELRASHWHRCFHYLPIRLWGVFPAELSCFIKCRPVRPGVRVQYTGNRYEEKWDHAIKDYPYPKQLPKFEIVCNVSECTSFYDKGLLGPPNFQVMDHPSSTIPDRFFSCVHSYPPYLEAGFSIRLPTSQCRGTHLPCDAY